MSALKELLKALNPRPQPKRTDPDDAEFAADFALSYVGDEEAWRQAPSTEAHNDSRKSFAVHK